MSDPNENGPRLASRPVGTVSKETSLLDAGKSTPLRGDQQGGEAVSDRELLELAAKAAGYTIRIEDDDDIYIRIGKKAYGFRWRYWNPLLDDGDALRLAVKLEFYDLDGLLFQFFDDPLIDTSKDPLAATRRAIVRAAAEIGRAMK